MKQVLNKIAHSFLFHIFLLAFTMNFTIECLGRLSLAGGLQYLTGSPLIFLYNTIIILLTLSVASFFKRRHFVIVLNLLLWGGLGIANGIVSTYRNTPLNAMDMFRFTSMLSITSKYFSAAMIVLIILAALALIGGLIFLFVKSKRFHVNFRRALASFTAVGVVFSLCSLTVIRSNAQVSGSDDLTTDYLDYGFAYCFSMTALDTGISKPDNYSQETIDSIVDSLDSKFSAQKAKTPNIVFLQLESFMDPKQLADYTFSEDPAPNFSALKSAGTSGKMTVPVIGGGTVNTEFEVLTGMSLNYFGPGEYPYKTALFSETTESVCYNLEKLGYTSHALHNSLATFYDRDVIFGNLGFDDYKGIDKMENAEYNTLGWAKDKVLTNEILKSLNSTEGRDFVYAISVQAHGKYPTQMPEGGYPISVFSDSADPSSLAEMAYYVNEVHEDDQFLGELVQALKAYPEDVVLVVYGDHLPALMLEDDDLTSGSIYASEYAVWSNFGLAAQDKNLAAYQLSANVLGSLGIHEGLLTKLNQAGMDEQTYKEDQHALQYDMFYGERYCWNGVTPYTPRDLKQSS